MATAAQRDFARSIYAAAQKATDIAPEFVTAQAILESGWGKSRIGKFNLFGITRGSNWKGHTVLILTHEYFNTPNRTFTAPEKVVSIAKCKTGNRWYYTVYRLFKDFDSLEECLQEHTRLLQKPGFADAWLHRQNAEEFAHRICDAQGVRYATSPTYLTQLLILIQTVRKICVQK
ncbi:glycoside hydrolase family 73 protein [Hoylesella marshii]|uniref:Mannosyl-glycoprotein endo-beta-N-acetylglucosaminidase n=1 Tax=Hoylesella marshii DSM 16973 = JCM 13450 TaxID=862515 RepID=E0NST7_9BACT|nr:glucosaminidase domain-containing protein [Hoylesella marshii]EFM01801.1 mannosyl-glycoprotein endo-beta-N-acetylglucosaminidase [Hoylesella marshii DSM 16973 = JCM 13450]